jgi:glycosyltransferase involved in cell wall biosynthesis
MPTVSIIIPTYNRAKLLRDAIDSAINQLFKGIELVVVDDGSTDETRQLVDSFLPNHNLKYVFQPHKGIPFARNNGLRNISGEYVSFLDSDDLYDRLFVESCLNFLENNPLIDIVITDALFIQEDGNRQIFAMPQVGSNEKYSFTAVLFSNQFFFLPCIMFRRKVFNDSSYFDETLPTSEDYDFGLRMSLNHKIDFLRKPLVNVRRHSSNITNNPYMMENRYNVLTRFANDNPNIIPANLANKRLAEVSKWIGDKYLTLKDNHKAREYLMKSVKHNLFDLSVLKNLIKSFI